MPTPGFVARVQSDPSTRGAQIHTMAAEQDGVRFLGELGRGAYATVHRVERDGVHYALKVLDCPGPAGDAALVAFRREAALLARVNHPGVPKVFDVGLLNGRPYVAMELIEGQPLSERLREGPLDTGTLVCLVQDVAATLEAVHRDGLVHRDVKPANIIIDDTGRARLIDIGLATMGRADSDDAVTGTFDYAAPEQTGMLARPVDGRADLYAFGVVLFQCATGRLPYQHADLGQLLALHAAAPVPDPRADRPDLPEDLAVLIVRLMAKDPDDRVQTAREMVTAATADEPDSPLIGRSGEQRRLVRWWRRAHSGRGGTVLIEGAAGVGKSVLARDLDRVARADGALVLAGKCAADTPLPMAPLRAAVDAYLGEVLTLPAAAGDAAVSALRAAAGEGGGLLRPLSPALASLIDAPRLDTEDRHDQFAVAVASFLAALATRHGGLLLRIDDVQWLDAASREVLRRLAEVMAEAPLLVVATTRDEESTGFAADERLAVRPLDDEAAAGLIRAYLAGPAVGAEVLAELAARGNGNPFTLIEYLHALIEAGALCPSWGEWSLDRARLRAIDLPSDVFDLVLARIDGLGPSAHETLTAAATLGFRFDPDLLAAVLADHPSNPLAEAAGPAEAPPNPLTEAAVPADGPPHLSTDSACSLAEAVERGLLHHDRDGYAFVHDRIREALLSAVEPAAMRQLHGRIATVLAGLDRDDPAHVYDLARHCASAGLDDDPERIFTTGWAAGRLALAEHAPDAALSFLQTAADGARAAGRTPDSRFHEALAVAYLRAGDAEAARAELEPALSAETDPHRRAALLLQLAHAHRTAWRMSDSIDAAHAGLAELGRPLPRNPVRRVSANLWTILWWLLTGGRRPARRPAATEHLRLDAQLCRAATAAAATGLRPRTAGMFNAHAIRRVHRLGPTAEYVMVYAAMGATAAGLRLHRRQRATFRRLRRIAADLGDSSLKAFLDWMEAYADAVTGRTDTAGWAEVAERNRRWLEVDHYLHAVVTHGVDLITRGYPDEALACVNRGRSRLNDPTAPQFPGLALVEAMARSLRGEDAARPAELSRLGEPGLETVHAVQLAQAGAQIAIEQDRLDEGFDAAAAVLAGSGTPMKTMFSEYRNAYVQEAFGRLARCRRAGDDRDVLLRDAAAAVRRLGLVARTSLLRGHHAVARAGLAQLRGEHRASLTLLAKAENRLVRLDAPLVQFEAALVRARALRALGDERPARGQAELALMLATRYGWARRARGVRAEFGIAAPVSQPSSVHPTDRTGDRYRRRLEALQQVGRAAATILDPQELIRVALDETLHILGAERAILFLTTDGGELRPSVGRTGSGELTDLTGFSASLVDRVAADRQALVVSGGEEGAALGSRSTIVHGLRSIMIAPLEREGRLLGVLYLDSRMAKGVFTDDDIAILTAIADQVTVALATARAAQLEVAVQVARRQRDTAEALRAAMSELSGILDPDEVLHRLGEIAARTLPADAVWVRHGESPDVTAPATGRAADAPPGMRPMLGDARFWLAAPLPVTGHEPAEPAAAGVLVAAGEEPFTPAQLDVAAALTGLGGAAYTNARLFAEVRRLATTDGLTGAFNRRHFTELATRQIATAVRNGRPLAAMMVDIDHFKKVNDTYGHATGDDVIRAVVGVLRAGVRTEDVLCRYGGEEFALVMTEMHGTAADVAERLRKQVESLSIPGPVDPIAVTVSIGTADLRPDDRLDNLLARADEALYRAKQSGRNQVQCDW
jgi:diguanylate cyclase (GGDEF)-like protein